MSCSVDRRCGPDLKLLWLWYRPVAAAPIQPLAWELPSASGTASKRKKKVHYILHTWQIRIEFNFLFAATLLKVLDSPFLDMLQ